MTAWDAVKNLISGPDEDVDEDLTKDPLKAGKIARKMA